MGMTCQAIILPNPRLLLLCQLCRWICTLLSMVKRFKPLIDYLTSTNRVMHLFVMSATLLRPKARQDRDVIDIKHLSLYFNHRQS